MAATSSLPWLPPAPGNDFDDDDDTAADYTLVGDLWAGGDADEEVEETQVSQLPSHVRELVGPAAGNPPAPPASATSPVAQRVEAGPPPSITLAKARAWQPPSRAQGAASASSVATLVPRATKAAATATTKAAATATTKAAATATTKAAATATTKAAAPVTIAAPEPSKLPARLASLKPGVPLSSLKPSAALTAAKSRVTPAAGVPAVAPAAAPSVPPAPVSTVSVSVKPRPAPAPAPSVAPAPVPTVSVKPRIAPAAAPSVAPAPVSTVAVKPRIAPVPAPRATASKAPPPRPTSSARSVEPARVLPAPPPMPAGRVEAPAPVAVATVAVADVAALVVAPVPPPCFCVESAFPSAPAQHDLADDLEDDADASYEQMLLTIPVSPFARVTQIAMTVILFCAYVLRALWSVLPSSFARLSRIARPYWERASRSVAARAHRQITPPRDS